MQVQVGSFWSSPRALLGGVPQGSILDVLPVLFKVTTDDLEQDFEKTQASFGTDPGAVVQGPPPSYSSLPLQMVVRSPSTSPPVGDFSSTPVRDGRPHLSNLYPFLLGRGLSAAETTSFSSLQRATHIRLRARCDTVPLFMRELVTLSCPD